MIGCLTASPSTNTIYREMQPPRPRYNILVGCYCALVMIMHPRRYGALLASSVSAEVWYDRNDCVILSPDGTA